MPAPMLNVKESAEILVPPAHGILLQHKLGQVSLSDVWRVVSAGNPGSWIVVNKVRV